MPNVQDACDGKMAKRSWYGNAPGGCVCLQEEMLQALKDYANSFYTQHGQPIQVNSLVGKFQGTLFFKEFRRRF